MLTPKSKSTSQIPHQSQLSHLQLTFKTLDPSNTGYIDKQTLQQTIMYTGDNYDKQIIRQQIQKCNDQISLKKFVQIFDLAEIEMNQLMANETLFKMYDRDGKGYIDAGDLRRVAGIAGVELGEDEIGEMVGFNQIAGQVLFDQFVDIMNDQNAWF